MQAQENYTPLQRFWQLLKPDKSEVRNVYIYAIFNGLISLSLPLGIQAIVNLIQGGRINTSWILLVVLVVGGIGLTGILQIIQLRITENLQQSIFTRSAFEFAYRIPHIKLEALYRHYAPELVNRFFDTISVQKGLSKMLIEFSSAALSALFGLVLLSFYHPFFILFSLILIVLVYFLFRFTAHKGMVTSLKESKNKYQVAHWLEEVARTGTTFKLAGHTDLPLRKADKLVGHYLKSRDGHFKVLVNQYSLLVVFKVVVATGLLAIGGILVMEQRMNIGQFVAAEIIILLVMTSVEKLVLSLETVYDVFTALEKIGQVTDLDIEDDKGEELSGDSTRGLHVEMRNVNFAYPGNAYNSLFDVTLNLKGGDNIVVTGESGSGKSTLLHVLAGLYNIQQGTLVYDDQPVANLNPISLRSLIGDYLRQEQIFEGSLYENISMGRDRASRENVQWAINHVGLSDFVKTLPEGYHTEIEPMGKKLPRSIVVKILLARCIADKPRLLLFEDNLDYLSEVEAKNLIDFLTDAERPWTLVAVSSDPYFMAMVDRVVVMEQGSIREENHLTDLSSIIR